MTNVPFLNSVTNVLSKNDVKGLELADALMDITEGNEKLDDLLTLQSSASEIDAAVDGNKKYFYNKGVNPVKNISNITGWTASDTGLPTISNTIDINNIFSGETLEVTSTVSGGNILASKTGFTPFSILQYDYISLYIWLDTISNSGSIFFNLYSGTKKYTYPIRLLMSGAGNEWHHIKIKISDMTVTNAITKKDLIDKLAIQTYGTAGKITKFKIADIILDNIEKPTISFTFDDNNLSDYTVAYEKMKQYGFTGSCYTISTAVGIAGRTTVLQMKEMYDAGWVFGIHGSDSFNWVSDSTLAEAENRIKTCRDWLFDNGFLGKCLQTCAYPQGQYNDDIISILEKLGIKQARSTILQLEYSQRPSNYKLRGKEFSSDFNINKKYIDDAIRTNGSVCFIIHNLNTEAFVTSFNQTVDYLAANYKDNVVTLESIIQG